MIILGDSLEVLKTLEPDSVDAVVTDPPYGLSFMGKKWDYDVPGVDMWSNVLRILKPGGYLLSFGGTRTYHRMVVAIEDAGFEIRDQIQWNFGSGFPKSRNLSGDWKGWGTALKPACEIVCMARKPATDNDLLVMEVRDLLSKCQWSLHALIVKENLASNQNVFAADANIAQWLAEKNTLTPDVLCGLMDTLPLELGLIFNSSIELSWLVTLADLYVHASTFTTSMASSLTIDLKTLNCLLSKNTRDNTIQEETLNPGLFANVENAASLLNAVRLKLTLIPQLTADASATDKPLRPNNEPIVLARKPLSESTVAKNVLRWGTGALNIDASRIEGRADKPGSTPDTRSGNSTAMNEIHRVNFEPNTQGRWPANLLLDETAATLLGEPARFFYVAKASKAERNRGLEGMPTSPLKQYEGRNLNPEGGIVGSDGSTRTGIREPVANHHPTVKPIKLMEYLIRLITPPGGIVLDPFMGSGSTGVAAKNLGFEFIGIEMNEEYVEIAKKRIG